MKLSNKKFLALTFAGVLSVSLVACSSNEGTTTEGNSTVENKTEEVAKVDGQLGDFNVKVLGSEIVKSTYDNEDILKVTLDFANNSEETVAFDMATMAKAYQNGIEIESAFDSEVLGDNASKEIRPGSKIEVNIGFIIEDKENPVEVEITNFANILNEDKILEVINLK